MSRTNESIVSRIRAHGDKIEARANHYLSRIAPDYKEKENLDELRELIRLLAWRMEYMTDKAGMAIKAPGEE